MIILTKLNIMTNVYNVKMEINFLNIEKNKENNWK